MKNLFKRPLFLKNSIQEYAWGSHNAIQNLLGNSPSERPWAELWLGAHPKAPSLVDFMNEWISLDSLIEKFPVEILGENIAKKYKNTLPYLFKVLAAERPLSIQAHPDARKAEEGFVRENRQKIPLNSPVRNYKDDRHKPECLSALTRFTVLKGFRNPQLIHKRMTMLCPLGLSDELKKFETHPHDLFKNFFKSLMTLPDEKKHIIISEALENAEKLVSQDDIFGWVLKLHEEYPEDIGMFSPILLNLIRLEPGQALFIPSGELHSYLDGMGIELMANSDNVIRGGLTPKHVDVPELLNVLSFEETKINILAAEPIKTGEAEVPISVEEFSLSKIIVIPGMKYSAASIRSAEIILCIQGSAHILSGNSDEQLALTKGSSVLIPASLDTYHIIGDATFYKAGVPII